VWNDPTESLENVNRRIHDGVPLESLAARAQSYVDQIVGLFPYARLKDSASIMEIGSGVGYIMEAMDAGSRARGRTPRKIVGLRGTYDREGKEQVRGKTSVLVC
jgi:hypothetical protein